MPKKSSLEKIKEIIPEPVIVQSESESESSVSSVEPILKPVKKTKKVVEPATHCVSQQASNPNKPKRELTEKQKESFAKARLVRAENIKARKEIKEKEDSKIQTLLNEKKAKKEAKLKKKQELELKKVDTSSDESSEEEIVVKKKKSTKKKKIVYVSDDEDDSNKKNVIIINNGEPKQQYPPARPKPVGVFL